MKVHFEILITAFHITLGFKLFRRQKLPVLSGLIVNNCPLNIFSTEQFIVRKNRFILRIVSNIYYKINSFLWFLPDVLINLFHINVRLNCRTRPTL